MPARIIREGINSSDRVNALSPLAELFYRRLLNVVDDYGRYHGSTATIRAACWPTCPDKVTDKQVNQWLSECLADASQLLIMYRVGQSTYLQVTDFRQQVRAKSKFPEPPKCEADAKQVISTCETNAHASRISYSEGDIRISSLAVSPSGSTKTQGTRFADSELPGNWQLWAVNDLGWTMQRALEVYEQFRDYWLAAAGAKARKVDWFATWRNWCRNDRNGGRSRRQVDKDPFLERLDEMMAEEEAKERAAYKTASN